MFQIVLLEPEIPQNTGNIGRTCVAAGSRLHLIEPMKFQINEKQLKRAGLDYWSQLDYIVHDSYDAFMDYYGGQEAAAGRKPKIYLATTKARQTYADVSFLPGDYIMFGKESAGIPEEILVKNPQGCIRIPMAGGARSLNLSNSVAIVLYEALRQNQFCSLERQGRLHRLEWRGQ